MCRIWCRSPIYCIDAHYFFGSIVVVYLICCIFQKNLRCLSKLRRRRPFEQYFKTTKWILMAATYFIKDFKIVVQSWLMDEKSTMYTVVHSTNFWGQKSRARVFWKRSKSNYSALYYFQIIFWKNHLIIWNDFIWILENLYILYIQGYIITLSSPAEIQKSKKSTPQRYSIWFNPI